MDIGIGHYLAVGAILFTIGVFGIFLNRKNVIIILMSIELILLSVNINFVAFSAHLGDLVGQVFALFVLTVAAAEADVRQQEAGLTLGLERIDHPGQPDGRHAEDLESGVAPPPRHRSAGDYFRSTGNWWAYAYARSWC